MTPLVHVRAHRRRLPGQAINVAGPSTTFLDLMRAELVALEARNDREMVSGRADQQAQSSPNAALGGAAVKDRRGLRRDLLREVALSACGSASAVPVCLDAWSASADLHEIDSLTAALTGALPIEKRQKEGSP